MLSNPTLLFCYGSLRTGEYNHTLLSRSKKIADAVVDSFVLYSLGVFPAMVPSDDPSSQVYGEVFEVDPSEFARINMMELGAGYVAQEVSAIQTEDLAKTIYQSLTYVFRDSKWLHDFAEIVPSGDWIKGAL